jgi:phosphoenolpyruvate phosphomutase
MTKAETFRLLLQSKELAFICEVHNALSARIVEEAGFKAMWGSSLTISASMGLRDNNEASWTQILEVVELISDVTAIPLLLDADTGYGDFNTVRRLVRKLEQRDIAAVCIEDKVFPKKNSFIGGEKQPLADIEEFSGKIKAAKDTQTDPDFLVIARVEAFIAGWGIGEALRRAEAYHSAGADAILIHSKLSRPDEVLAFKKQWGDRCPVIVVPTKYYTTHTDVFRDAGFSAVIWANMILRSAIMAMEETSARIMQDQSVLNVEDKIAPISEIFRLQQSDELEMAESVYLPGGVDKTHALILAASQGADLGDLTKDKPKAMIEISGKPLLYKQVDLLNETGIKNITVVRGFAKDTINIPNLNYVDNDSYAGTQEVFSLYKGIQGITNDVIVSYGDILCKKYIPLMLLESSDDFVAVVDADWELSHNKGRYTDFVSCNRLYDKRFFDQDVNMTQMNPELPAKDICGEWIGLFKLSAWGVGILKEILGDVPDGRLQNMRMAELFNEIIQRDYTIKVQYISGHWLDVDDIKDISSASTF